MRIAIGSEHAGYRLKAAVREELARLGREGVDVGTDSADVSLDHPDLSIPGAEAVAHGDAVRGVVVGATGIGARIAANEVPGARVSRITRSETARLTREHNDSNILALGGMTAPSIPVVPECSRARLDTPFAGGRHERRVDEIREYEAQHSRP